MKPLVFLGPSCPDLRAGPLSDIELRPPAVRGDLDAARSEGRSTIVLIDGEMVHGYAPSPGEVLDALRAGIRVFGAASLGALRAVELLPFGMIGHGWIFEAFRRGYIAGDDELVSLLLPESLHTLTVPLVRVRHAIGQLVAAGAMAAAQGRAALHDLKGLHYEQRTPNRVEAALERVGIDGCLRARIGSAEFDIKRIDALSCIRYATGRGCG